MKINWNYPTSMWVGENRVEDISKACEQLEISNPLFVTDKDLIKLDMTNKILLNLKKEFPQIIVFSDFSGNAVIFSFSDEGMTLTEVLFRYSPVFSEKTRFMS